MKHPAPYTPGLLPIFSELLKMRFCHTVLDPFAGTGRIHQLRADGFETTGVEIEPEWAEMSEGTITGDSTNLLSLFPFDKYFDCIVTSPCYGNRFADSHEAKDGSERRSYTHDLGHTLHINNSGAMQWGDAYRKLHHAVWLQCVQMLRPGGVFLLNIKDHIRNFQRQYVGGWHVTELARLGFTLEEHHALVAGGMTKGDNRQRVAEEVIYVFRKD